MDIGRNENLNMRNEDLQPKVTIILLNTSVLLSIPIPHLSPNFYSFSTFVSWVMTDLAIKYPILYQQKHVPIHLYIVHFKASTE